MAEEVYDDMEERVEDAPIRESEKLRVSKYLSTKRE